MIAIKLQAASSLCFTSPLRAKPSALKQHSTCAEGLPDGATEWDVSKFIVQGQHVHAPTIRAWLSAVAGLEADIPKPRRHTLIGLGQLLGFADAVGSSSEVLRAIDATVSAEAGFAAEVYISGGSRYTFGFCQSQAFSSRDGEIWQMRPTACPTANSIADASRIVAEQVEPLLYLAYKLQMPKLQEVLHQFLSSSWSLDAEKVTLGSCFCALSMGLWKPSSHQPRAATSKATPGQPLDRVVLLGHALSARVREAAAPAATSSGSNSGSSSNADGSTVSALAGLQQQLDSANRKAATSCPVPQKVRLTRRGAPALLRLLRPLAEGVLYLLRPLSEAALCVAATAMVAAAGYGVLAGLVVVISVLVHWTVVAIESALATVFVAGLAVIVADFRAR